MEKEFVYFVDDTWIDLGAVKIPAIPCGYFKTFDLAVFYIGTKCGAISRSNKNKYDITVSIHTDGFSDDDIKKHIAQVVIVTFTEKGCPNVIKCQRVFNIYKYPFYSDSIEIE